MDRLLSGGPHAYLVPFRALASELFDSFQELLAGTSARIRVVTGDHRDPVRPDEADLVIATYESFARLLRSTSFQPGVVVADEVHLLADQERGPLVEGLLAGLLSSGRCQSLCALSATVANAAQLADWLGVPLIEGTASDRPVPLEVSHQLADDLDEELVELLAPCRDGEQALVFCSSRSGAEKAARLLAERLPPQPSWSCATCSASPRCVASSAPCPSRAVRSSTCWAEPVAPTRPAAGAAWPWSNDTSSRSRRSESSPPPSQAGKAARSRAG